MSWINKQKTLQSFDEGDIVTPDGIYQILVGSSEDLVLVFRNAGDNWSKKAIQDPGTWTTKTKTVV